LQALFYQQPWSGCQVFTECDVKKLKYLLQQLISIMHIYIYFSAQYMELEDRHGRLEQELRERMAINSKFN